MNYVYNPSFVRDVKKITKDNQLNLLNAINEIKSAGVLSDISNVKKLKGYKDAYRIKINTYRSCFFYNDDKILILSRFLPRKDVYRFFP